MRRPAEINVMLRAAHAAGRGLARDFGEVENLQVSEKGPGDFVSVADRQAERRIVEELERARPRYGFLLEESGAVEGADTSNRWVVDPLDGTGNFLHGIPHFCISIALERDGEPIAALVYNPLTDDTYWAARGIGAYANNRRLRVSARARLPHCILATGEEAGAGSEALACYLRQHAALKNAGVSLRRFGAAALDLAWVADGRLDGFWHSGLRRWDIAAGVLLVREAGGAVTDTDGSGRVLETGNILAANDRLHGHLCRIMAETERPAPVAPSGRAA